MLPQLANGVSRAEALARAQGLLAAVGLSARMDHRPAEMSGGEQQRVGIARAVATRPKIILADEPAGNLDPALSNDIMAFFRAFSPAGVTVLIATHDLPMISRMQHRIFTLQDGRHMGTAHHD